jgi:hypothetical protein
MLIPFAIFFGCCIAQFWFLWRIRQVLVSRHSDEWLNVSKSLFFSPLPWRFVWSRRRRELGDPVLTRRVMEMRSLSFVAYAAWAALAVGVFHPY